MILEVLKNAKNYFVLKILANLRLMSLIKKSLIKKKKVYTFYLFICFSLFLFIEPAVYVEKKKTAEIFPFIFMLFSSLVLLEEIARLSRGRKHLIGFGEIQLI